MSELQLVDLQRQVEIQENFASRLQDISSNLQESVKTAKLGLDSKKMLSEGAENEKENAFLDCKTAVSELGQCLNQLHQQCNKMSSAMCPEQPQLMFQMPLDELRTARKVVENNLKLLIIKQFQRKYQEANSNDGDPALKQPQFNHLIEAPDKKKYERQCRDLEKLQAEHGKSLANSMILKARNDSLKTAIDLIKNKTQADNLNLVASPTEFPLKQLENDIRKAAAKSAANKSNMITLANMTVKQTRLQYYLEKMTKVEQMLQKQTSIDKLFYNMLKVESEITQEANHFLAVVGSHFKQETDNLAQNVQLLYEMQAAVAPEPQSISLVDDPLMQEFQSKSLATIEKLSEQINNLRKRHLLLDTTGTFAAGQDELAALTSSVIQLEKLLEDFKSDVHSGSLEFMKTKERLKMCQNLKPPVDLWQIFLASPEQLEPYLPKQ